MCYLAIALICTRRSRDHRNYRIIGSSLPHLACASRGCYISAIAFLSFVQAHHVISVTCVTWPFSRAGHHHHSASQQHTVIRWHCTARTAASPDWAVGSLPHLACDSRGCYISAIASLSDWAVAAAAQVFQRISRIYHVCYCRCCNE